MAKGVATMPRVFLGEALRQLRDESGRTLDDMAACVRKSRTRMINLLNGEATLTDDELTAVAVFLGAKGQRLRELQALGAEARKPPTGDPYTDLGPDSWRRVAYLEAKARVIHHYVNSVFPAQIQSPEYIESSIRAAEGIWLDELDDQKRQSRVDFRLERQRRVFHSSESKRVHLFFAEDALDAGVGSPSVMRAQLAYMLDAIQNRKNLTVQIVPKAVWDNPLQGGGLMLFEFGPILRPVGFLPVAYGPSTYLHKPEDTQRISRAFDKLKGLALDPKESEEVIKVKLEGF